MSGSKLDAELSTLLAALMTISAQYPPLPRECVEEDEMKTFVAYAKTTEGDPCVRITSVLALDEADAKYKIRTALDRSGKWEFYNRWKKDGKIVREEEQSA